MCSSLDYAVVIVGAVFIFASVSWIVSAHKWFKGPLPNIDGVGSSRDSQASQVNKEADSI